MRMLGLTALAALLFVGGFAVARAQDEGLRGELAALERAAADQRIARAPVAPEPPRKPRPLHRIPVITVTSPILLRNPPGYADAYWGEAEVVSSGPGPTEWGPQPFGTIEEIAELLGDREAQLGFARPTLFAEGYELVYRGSPEGAARIEGYLEKEMRPRVLRTAAFEVDWVMGAGRGGRSFRARFLSLVGSRSMFWVGRQQAVLADTDVVVPGGPHGATDPAVWRIFSGEWILPELTGSGSMLASVIAFESRGLEGTLRRVETRYTGTLDMPRIQETVVQSPARLHPGQWEVIHRGDGLLRVRAHVLPRGGER